MKTNDIFISKNSIANKYIRSFEYPYEILNDLENYIVELGKTLNKDFKKVDKNIWIHKSANVSNMATINGPCIIDATAEVRPYAYIRGSVIIGKNSVVGNSCELKNCILFDEVEAPHYNYIGDSILGFHSHLGAGVILSNIKSDKKNIIIKYNGESYITNRRKIGSFLGDYVEVGCNSVLNPGTIVKHDSVIYPLTSVRGVIEDNMIVKDKNTIVKKEKR